MFHSGTVRGINRRSVGNRSRVYGGAINMGTQFRIKSWRRVKLSVILDLVTYCSLVNVIKTC